MGNTHRGGGDTQAEGAGHVALERVGASTWLGLGLGLGLELGLGLGSG